MTGAATSPLALDNEAASHSPTGPSDARHSEEDSTIFSPDLARIALLQWIAAARFSPPTVTRRRLPRSSQAASGRDPVGLGAAVGSLATSHGWLDGLASERVRHLWTELFPGLREHAVVAGFDVQQRLLVLQPMTRAAGAHIRLHERRLLDVLAEAVGDQVRGLKVLLPDARAGANGETPPLAASEAEPTVTTASASRPGFKEYLRTRELLRALRQPQADMGDVGPDPFASTRNTLRAPEPQEPPQRSPEALLRRQAERTHRLDVARARAERQQTREAM